MLRFLSRFRGSSAMLHSSTSSGGVTEFSVYKEQSGDGEPGPAREGHWAGLVTPFGGWRHCGLGRRDRSGGLAEQGLGGAPSRNLRQLLQLSASVFLNCKTGK